MFLVVVVVVVVGVNCFCEPAKSLVVGVIFSDWLFFHVSLALATTNEIGKQGNHRCFDDDDDDDDEYSSSVMERNR